MDRRAFIGTLASGLFVASSAHGEAQQRVKVVRIGWLDPSPTPTAATPSRALTAFKQRLGELGYVEGRDVVIESRFADTYWDRLPGQAQDLVSRRVDIIVTIGTATVMVAKKATTTIPIVMAGVGEPLELGLVPSLAHPGGNVTGVAHNPGPEFAGKGLELLKDAAPNISRVAVLWDSGALHENPSLEGQRSAARQPAPPGRRVRRQNRQRRETWRSLYRAANQVRAGGQLKTAKAFGLAIPQSILLRADEVIR